MFPFKQFIIFCGLLILAFVLVLLPADFFDGSTAICLSRIFFDMECYACGMTRACMRIIHFRFSEAKDFNPLAFAVMPLLCFIWARELHHSGKVLMQFYRQYSGKA